MGWVDNRVYVPCGISLSTEKVRDRFPTFFMYHELAREIPLLAKEMEAESQTLGSWKARQLSGSDDGGSPSRLITRPQSWSDDAPLDKEVRSSFVCSCLSADLVIHRV